MFQIQQITNSNPLKNHFHITNEKVSCKIYQNLGASIQEFSKNGISIIKGFDKVDDYKMQHTSSILCPFPGRVEHGKYDYDNNTYQLETNENNRNNAIHGKVAHEFFECIHSENSENKAVLTFSYTPKKLDKGYPFAYRVQAKYIITNENLLLDISIENLDETNIPFGLGWHPYFVCPDMQSSILQFNSTKEILCDTEMIPIDEKAVIISSPFKIEDLHFDTCFTLNDKKVSLQTDTYSIDMVVLNSENQFIQIFTPHSRDCIALEPMTCAPDAFNNQMGLLELKPSTSYTYSIKLNFKTHE